MATELSVLFEELRSLKENLLKLSYEKRTSERLLKRLDEATNLFNNYSLLIPEVEKQIGSKTITGESLSLVKYYCEQIEKLYSDINTFCTKEHIKVLPPSNSKTDTLGETSSYLATKKSKMEFDLKLALSLLPVMTTDDESTVKRLIDGIDYYSSTLTKPQCEQNLINFVLKNRLSQNAKLKLSSSYASVNDLLLDMNSILLPKKSSVALQNKLQSSRQDQKTIDDYGRELSEIFMDLSIAQASGKSENLKILQPLNEKQAIKRFSDGLRNRRLGTIIAARNFDTLKDAVQAAIDEEVTMPSTSGDIFSMNNRYNKSFRGSNRGRNFSRGAYNNQYRGRGFNPNFSSRPPFHRGSSFYRSRGYQQQHAQRGQQAWSPRGKYPNFNNRFNGNHGIRQNANIRVINENSTANTENDPSYELNKFFRD